MNCLHCCDAKYVFIPWLKRMLMEREIRMAEIPPDIFAEIPVELIYYCHCNPRITLFGRSRWGLDCADCAGTTWRLTEVAPEPVRSRKVCDFSFDEIGESSCRWFERCPCGLNDAWNQKEKMRQLLGLMSRRNSYFSMPSGHFRRRAALHE